MRVRPAWFRAAALVAGYLLAALVFTWPLVLVRNDWLIGDQELPAFMWRSWWMRHILADGWAGADGIGQKLGAVLLAGHSAEAGNLTDMALAWPLQDVFGYPIYHNLKCVLILVFNALCGYGAARIVLRGREGLAVGPWLAGIIVAFNPYVVQMINIGRLREAILGLVALSAAMAWRMLADDEGSPWRAALTGVVSGLAANFYWFYAHFVFLWAVVAMLWRAGARWLRPADDPALPPARVWLRNVGIALWFFFALCLPAAAPYVVQQRTGEQSGIEYRWKIPPLPDLEAWHDPHDQQSWLINSQRRMLSESCQPEVLFDLTREDAIPIIVSLLALAAALAAPRRAAPWLAGALFFYLMSLGPYLRWHGQFFHTADGQGIELPHAFFYRYLPAFSRLYAPNRASAMLMVCLGMLAAIALNATLRRIGSRALEQAAAGVICTAGVLAPMWLAGALPLRFIPARLPLPYQVIAGLEGGMVVEIPAESNRDEINFYQTVHEHPLVGGWAAMPLTALSQRWVRVGTSLPRTVAHLLDEGATPTALQSLRQQGVRFVVVHQRYFSQMDVGRGEAQYAALCAQLEALLGPPLSVGTEGAPESDAFRPPPMLQRPPTTREIRAYDLDAAPPGPDLSK